MAQLEQNPGPNHPAKFGTRLGRIRDLKPRKAGAVLSIAWEPSLAAAGKKGAPLVPNAQGSAPKSGSSDKAVAGPACKETTTV